MMVVIEGSDGSGKSVLARTLVEKLQAKLDVMINLKLSGGPEKEPGEMILRTNQIHRDYIKIKHQVVIYDRHPAVSQNIYASLDPSKSTISKNLAALSLYDENPFIIYCRGGRLDPLTQNQPWDTSEYIDLLLDNRLKLETLYDMWAVEHANMIYRVGDPISLLASLLEERFKYYEHDN